MNQHLSLAAFRFHSGALIAAAFLGLGSPGLAEPAGPAKRLIDRYAMEKIPVEGAWFAVTYTSQDRISAAALPDRYGSARAAGGAIYALVTCEDFSALHRLKTDEVWHFYSGEPMEMLLLYPDGRDEVVVLGADPFAGQRPQFTVPAGAWMGARPIKTGPEAYAFFGTTMAPGFDPADFEAGYRDELQQAYPARREMIAQLTRAELATRPAEPVVFAPRSVPGQTLAPGVVLQELVGRVGHARTDRASVARFALAPGKGTGLSYNKAGEEYFLVISGHGIVVVAGVASPVETGSVVMLRPGAPHSLTAAPDAALEFYAVSAPAFSPDDYVPVNATK